MMTGTDCPHTAVLCEDQYCPFTYTVASLQFLREEGKIFNWPIIKLKKTALKQLQYITLQIAITFLSW